MSRACSPPDPVKVRPLEFLENFFDALPLKVPAGHFFVCRWSRSRA
jgi:hypothetical protein